MHKYTTQHRCCVCHKLLAQSHNLRGRLEIKCPRCKRVAVFNNQECREHLHGDAYAIRQKRL
ncbi:MULTISPECIES: hypothetical protein [Cardiobacterium]|uniref:Com family DNA-binding transcriptional regulator n=1 Tax=Cardiobacterium valvarum F0432 TaxID=797473 RepID=G9ZDG2_9GAMM|nr:hypothetical protein HMPREF9080_00796 [Cardiobacterium valvarum F0432]